jgi:hypothetical protein
MAIIYAPRVNPRTSTVAITCIIFITLGMMLCISAALAGASHVSGYCLDDTNASRQQGAWNVCQQ